MLFLINSSNSCLKIRIDDSAAGFDFLFNILYIVLLGIEQLNLDIFIGEVSLNFIAIFNGTIDQRLLFVFLFFQSKSIF